MSIFMRWQVGIDALVNRYEGSERTLTAGLSSKMNEAAKEIQSFAMANHPWQNQTGAAERTLTAGAVDGGRIVYLQHGVFYGIYLETMQGGRYSVLPNAMGSYGLPLINRYLQELAMEAVR